MVATRKLCNCNFKFNIELQELLEMTQCMHYIIKCIMFVRGHT
jgi:hypothetical protein